MKFILSKIGYQNLIVNEFELPYWILLYDNFVDGETSYLDTKFNHSETNVLNIGCQNSIAIDLHPIWSNSKFCDNALKLNGLSLQYVKVKTYNHCECAVGENGDALEFVPQHLIDYNLCFRAVKRNRFAIRFVPQKYQTEELCMIAIKGRYKSGLLYFREMMTKTDPEYTENGYVLKYIMNQTSLIVKYALECTPDAFMYVNDKNNEMIEYRNKCKLKIEKDSKFYEGMFSLFI